MTGMAVSRHYLLSTATIVMATTAFAGSAFAQLQPATSTAPALEEVVITARKRTETLQSVPVSASVVGGEAVAAKSIVTIQDLTNTLPAVKLAKGSTTNRQFIRGIGSGDNPAFEQSVGVFVDGVYHGRARSSEATLFDLDRVEVLKGPQTIYFGNNAIAGALNVITKDPGRTFGGNVRLGYTPTFKGYAAEASVDLPVNDKLSVRVAGQLSGDDGWIKDVAAGDVPRTRNAAARGTILWRPTDDFTAKVKAQYGQVREKGGLALVRGGCPAPSPFPAASGFCAAAIAAGAGPYSSDFDRNTSAGQFMKLTSADYSADLSWDRGAFTIDSITAYSRYSFSLGTDLDFTPAPLLSGFAPERYRQFSQELRITSDTSGPIEYVAGAYYQHSELNSETVFKYGFLTPTIAAAAPFAGLVPYLPLGVEDRFREEADTTSAFGALTWKPTDKLRITSALRYTSVDKDFLQAVNIGTAPALYGRVTPFPGPVAALGAAFVGGAGLAKVGTIALSRKDDHLSPSVSVQYQANGAVMVYGRYDGGFKAGGFNGVDLSGLASALPFAPEKVAAFEAGVKARLLDNRASLNLSLFHSKYSDLQLAGVAPTTTGAYVNRVQNAGGAVSRGVEFEGSYIVTDALRSDLSVTLLDSHYTAYPNATPTALQTLQGLKVQDLKGARTAFAPRASGAWALTYTHPVTSSLTLRVNNTMFASSHFQLSFNNDPNTEQKSYVRDDLTIALASDRGWEVSLIGKNLTDETIRTYGASIPSTLGVYVYANEPPRSITLQFRREF